MRNKIIVMLVLMMVLTGCSKADSADILLQEDESSLVEASYESSLQETETVCEKQTFVIFVCGAVNNPGVYYLEEGLRIVDAIDAAGGFSEDADRTYVNLAAPLTDGIKLQIPTAAEAAEGMSFEAMDSFSQDENKSVLVNINRASVEELKTLPGIGDGIAGRIVEYRTENGNFSSIEDIKKVSGIKDKLFSKIKDHITV